MKTALKIILSERIRSFSSITLSSGSAINDSTTLRVAGGDHSINITSTSLNRITTNVIPGWEQSTDGSTWKSNISALAPFTAHIRLKGTTIGTFNGFWNFFTPGAATQSVTITGSTAAPTITQVQSKFYGSASTNSSHNIVWNSTPTNGNWLVLIINASDSSINAPAGWQPGNFATGACQVNVYFKRAASESTTVNFTFGTSVNACACLLEFSGLSQGYDGHTSTTGQTGTTISTGTTSATNDPYEVCIAIAAFLWASGGPQSVSSWSAGYTSQGNATSSAGTVGLDVATLYTTAVGTQTATATLNTSIGTNNCGDIVTFK